MHGGTADLPPAAPVMRGPPPPDQAGHPISGPWRYCLSGGLKHPTSARGPPACRPRPTRRRLSSSPAS